MSKILAQPGYLNQPETVVEQVITGRYADGLGKVQFAPDRVDFKPFPYPAMAMWLGTQMKRWNMLKPDTDIRKLADEVMLSTQARRLIAEAGGPAPGPDDRIETIMGDKFDPSKI